VHTQPWMGLGLGKMALTGHLAVTKGTSLPIGLHWSLGRPKDTIRIIFTYVFIQFQVKGRGGEDFVWSSLRVLHFIVQKCFKFCTPTVNAMHFVCPFVTATVSLFCVGLLLPERLAAIQSSIGMLRVLLGKLGVDS